MRDMVQFFEPAFCCKNGSPKKKHTDHGEQYGRAGHHPLGIVKNSRPFATVPAAEHVAAKLECQARINDEREDMNDPTLQVCRVPFNP